MKIAEKIPFEIGMDDVIKYTIRRRIAGDSISLLAGQFHAMVAEMIRVGCLRSRELTGLKRVALSGGCFQNLLLLRLCEQTLKSEGFEVYRHTQVPPNDGGLALGQAAIAAARI